MKVLKDSFIYLIGELFAKSLPFLMLPYLTRKLGPDGFGELSYYLTMLSLFTIFVGLSQDGAVTRYFYFYGKKALNTVVKAGYLFNIAISIVLLLGCWWLKAEIMAYVVLATMFQSFVNVQLALRQCQKQPLKYITIQIILSLTNVLFTVAALEYFSQDLVAYRVLAIAAANLTTFLIASLVLGDLFRDNYHFTWHRLRLGLLYIFSFGLPLILHQSSFFIKGQLDRILIYQQYSKADLGIYSAGVQIAAVLPIVLMALNKAIVPYYYQGLKNNSLTVAKIKKYTLYSLPLSILPAIVGWLLPEQVYLWFLGQSYVGSKYYVVMYFLGSGINLPYLILVNYLFYHGQNLMISKITMLSSVIYLLFLYIFANKSIELLPFALLISNFILILSMWWMLSNAEKK
ncbi:flippase [Acinetobacter baumannii]|nr:flippase [Acinetobacter baumannii]MDI9691639.1 flippase [Acinetobacter baumannii]